jgi:hypothetical protein
VSLSPFQNLSGALLTVTVDCSRQTRLLRLRSSLCFFTPRFRLLNHTSSTSRAEGAKVRRSLL